MILTARFQVLTCLVLYACSVQAISVKFGTKMGPIEPPEPEKVIPAKQPYRVPAPVWEERIDDAPSPLAQWRPNLFVPQPRYTKVVYELPNSPPHARFTNTQLFVNAYLPKNKPAEASPSNDFFTPAQTLGSKTLPGIGIRYFVPVYLNSLQEKKFNVKQENGQTNSIETNDIEVSDSSSDLEWIYNKESIRNNIKLDANVSKNT